MVSCCENCMNDFKTINYSINYNIIKNVYLLCNEKSILFLFQELKNFLFDFNEFHTISYEVKERNTNYYSNINNDERDSDDEYEPYNYYYNYIQICKKCMIFSIENYLQNFKRLPYLRRDYLMFLLLKNNKTKLETCRKMYESFKDKYILPKIYSCSYYRSQQPIYDDNLNKYIIPFYE